MIFYHYALVFSRAEPYALVVLFMFYYGLARNLDAPIPFHENLTSNIENFFIFPD